MKKFKILIFLSVLSLGALAHADFGDDPLNDQDLPVNSSDDANAYQVPNAPNASSYGSEDPARRDAMDQMNETTRSIISDAMQRRDE